MKIIVQFLKLWLWLLAFMTLLPIDCLAQTNYELVIEMRDGTKRFAPIPKEYDNLYDLPHIMTYPDEEGNTRGEFQVNWKEGENYGQIKVLTKDVHLVYTREAKSVTVTAKDYSIYQGDQIPEFDYWTSGVELIGKPELTCEATSDSPVGKYPIKVSRGTVENEDVVFVDGWLYIQERDTPPTSVQVTPDDQEMVYGDPVPELTYKVEGGTLSGTPEISCEATSTSPIGSYPIIASKGSVTTDDVIYNTAYLSINSAPLTITAKSYTIKQGEPMPTFEAEYAGFKNNETPAILSELPQIEPIDAERWVQIADTDTPGEYTLLIHGLTIDGNYEIEYINGKLTIEAAEPVVIDPVDDDVIVSFGDEIDENTDLSDNVIDNTYYNMDANNGDGYDANTQAIVLNSTTSADQMNAIQGANVGDAFIHENYNGIIFELASGKGTVSVDVQTIGTHVLMVQIGNNTPTKVTKSERGTVDVPYNVAEPTYVYLYARTADGGAARLSRAAAGENSVLLYGYKVTIGDAFIPGDVNGDGLVNVTDIVATVNFIMEKSSDGFNKAAADLSGDGDINVTDIVKMVSIIMNGNGGSSRRVAATSSHLVINRNNIQLRNAEAYTAAQFDIHLSDGQSISNVVLNGSSNHNLSWKMVDANTCRVVVYSMTNAVFRANNDNLFTVFMNGSQDATISNELLIKAEGTTGIDAIRTEAENGNVYDLNGRQVKTPGKGVYIIKTDNKTIKMTRK